MSDTKLREKADALIAFTLQGPRFIAWVQAVTDALAPAPEKVAKVSAFPVGNCVVCGELVAPYNKHAKYEGGYTCQRPQPAPPEPEKVKCPNCGEAVDHSLVHVVEWSAHGAKRYDCPKYAQPEPAAPEMPEAVKEAIDFLRELGNEGNPNKQCTENICRQRADVLESWWRNLAQPVAVKVYHYPSNEMPGWAECGEQIERGDSMPEWNHVTCERCQGYYRARREYEQKLAAQGRKVALGKVRRLLEKAEINCALTGVVRLSKDEISCALAELDAAEKGEGRG